MIGYSRKGIYNPNLKAKQISVPKKEGIDIINIILFIFLLIALAIFILT